MIRDVIYEFFTKNILRGLFYFYYNFSIIELLKSFFETKGHKCATALDGVTALELVEKYSPKLVLLDIILPDLSGYEICNIIKSEKRNKDILIFYITAVTRHKVKERMKDTGADGYFLKPFKMTDFKKLFEYL